MKDQDPQENALVEKEPGSDLVVDVDVKVKILHTIAKAIYATPIGKIREAVANAMDNEATWIIILADRTTKSLCIYDNGHGISKAHFQEIFKSIGYGLLSDEIFNIVRPLNRILREIWENKNKVVEGVIDPFKNITEPGGPLQTVEQRLRRMVDPKDEQGFHQDMFDRLKVKRVKEIEDPEARVDFLLSKASEQIILGEDEKLFVCIDPDIKDEPYQVSWDKDRETVKVSISPELFKPREAVFLGKTFLVVFVAKKDSDPGVSIDIDDSIIYINPFNKELIQYNVSIIDVMIALEVADAISNDQSELKKNFLTIIGARTTIAAKYVTPLGDELRRFSAFAPSGE